MINNVHSGSVFQPREEQLPLWQLQGILEHATVFFQYQQYADAVPRLWLALSQPLDHETALPVLIMAAKAEFAMQNYRNAQFASSYAFQVSKNLSSLSLCGLILIAEGSHEEGVQLVKAALNAEVAERAVESPEVSELFTSFESTYMDIQQQIQGLDPDAALALLEELYPYSGFKIAPILALCKACIYFSFDLDKAQDELYTALLATRDPIVKLYLKMNFAIAYAATGNSIQALQMLNQVFG